MEATKSATLPASTGLPRGVFVGSGVEGMKNVAVCSEILQLVGKPPAQTNILYLGTATYDLRRFFDAQVLRFREIGCIVDELKCTNTGDCTVEEMVAKTTSADVVIVSGGNTLHAVQRWNAIGLTGLLRAACNRGVVLAGGSAGAICWFDGGHSDSADPETYKAPFLAGEVSATIGQAPAPGSEAKPWKYLRVSGLGFLPGLICPHADKVQSNGLLRILDFDDMLLRHPMERGLCIDHFAALIVDGENYRVLSMEGKEGSCREDGTRVTDRSGRPAIWVKDVTEDGGIATWLVPEAGKLSDILKPATTTEEDPAVADCIAENPFDMEI